jgi:hypothetical protein
MSAYNASCASSTPLPAPSDPGVKAESTAMLRLFCTYDSLVRFVMPLCSSIPGRPHPETPITGTNCIVDISGVGLLHFWRLRAHMQAASTLATAHYPETLGRTYVSSHPLFKCLTPRRSSRVWQVHSETLLTFWPLLRS